MTSFTASNRAITTTRPINARDIALFQRDGFVLLPGFFGQHEIAPLREGCLADPILHCSYNTIENSPIVGRGQDHHRYRPFVKLPDSVLEDGVWQDVFKDHEFNDMGDDGKADIYGYKTMTRG